MFDYAEKRDFPRMLIDSPARIRMADAADSFSVSVKNLSSTDMLMPYGRDVDAGTRLAIEILPGKNITPPLSAVAYVVRSAPSGDGMFQIACQIQRILPTGGSAAD